MKKGYTRSLITTASSKTNYLQRSNTNNIKVTCIYSNISQSKSKNQKVIKSNSNRPINYKKNFYKYSNDKNKNNNNLDNLTSSINKKTNQKLKILKIFWYKDIKQVKQHQNNKNNYHIKLLLSNKKSYNTDLQIKKLYNNNINNNNNINYKTRNDTNEKLNDENDTISNFLNYNLGEMKDDQEFEEDFIEHQLDPFINSLIDKKKKKNNKEEIKNEKSISEKEFDLTNFNKFKSELTNRKKEIEQKKYLNQKNNIINNGKRNISELTQNSSYYYSNTEELKPSEKIHSIYNSKFSIMKK